MTDIADFSPHTLPPSLLPSFPPSLPSSSSSSQATLDSSKLQTSLCTLLSLHPFLAGSLRGFLKTACVHCEGKGVEFTEAESDWYVAVPPSLPPSFLSLPCYKRVEGELIKAESADQVKRGEKELGKQGGREGGREGGGRAPVPAPKQQNSYWESQSRESEG